jgi:hypothetical protein
MRSFTLPEQTGTWQPKLQHWAALLTSGRADQFKKTPPSAAWTSTPKHPNLPAQPLYQDRRARRYAPYPVGQGHLAVVFGVAGLVWIIYGVMSPRWVLYPLIGFANLGIAYLCKRCSG